MICALWKGIGYRVARGRAAGLSFYVYMVYVTVPGWRGRMCENSPDYPNIDPLLRCGIKTTSLAER